MSVSWCGSYTGIQVCCKEKERDVPCPRKPPNESRWRNDEVGSRYAEERFYEWIKESPFFT
jgi:hypothetical protein